MMQFTSDATLKAFPDLLGSKHAIALLDAQAWEPKVLMADTLTVSFIATRDTAGTLVTRYLYVTYSKAGISYDWTIASRTTASNEKDVARGSAPSLDEAFEQLSEKALDLEGELVMTARSHKVTA